ncbi:zinc finger protein 16-like [Engraulis encrasicolus]|uniref:zinc finger protein 16-like n=1 Tax=Engraulis encrasicolus TaxID=184585 RepID=UPI002FD4F88F
MASAEVNCPLQLMRSVKEETEEFTFPDSPSQLNVKEEARQFPGSPPQLRSVKEDSEEILRSLYSLRRVSVVLVDCCRPQRRQKNNEENHRDAEARKRSDENQTAHTSSDQHQCPTCGKGFAEKSKLIAHQRIHYHCTTCGKGFAQKSHLIRHQCVHAARENPSLCSTYGAAFFRTTSLADHQRTHTGESPYQCTTCGKGFTLKCNLITHQRTHTGPYQCATCGKSFQLKEAFNKHQKKHTDKSHWSTRRRGLF